LLEAQKEAQKHEADKLAHFSKIESVYFIRPSRSRDVALHYQHPKIASKPKKSKLQVRSALAPKKEYLQGQDWLPVAEVILPVKAGPSLEEMTEVNHKQLVQELKGRSVATRRQSNSGSS